MLSRYVKRHLPPTAVSLVVPAVAIGFLVHSAIIACMVLVLGLVAFVPLTNAYLRGQRSSWLRIALVDAPYFVHWTAGFIALPIVVLAVVVELAIRAAHGVLAFPTTAFIASYVLACIIAAYGALVRRRVVQTQRIELAVVGLHPSFDGYRIAHLSDMHISSWTPRSWGMRWARAASALACDLVVVTGDMVANGTAFHEDIADVIGAMRAKDGVVVALGNHDYIGDADLLVDMLRARGVRVLRNAGERLVRGRERVYLAAIDDRCSRRADLEKALDGRMPDEPVILLAHDPVDFPKAADAGASIVLSGHTHGGQIALPFVARHVNLSRPSFKHTLGVYSQGQSWLVVHPGLGTSGPPVRIGVPPAIIEITLRSVVSLARSDSSGAEREAS